MNEQTNETIVNGIEPQLNFAIWPANTTITLCNVPWDQQAESVVRFANRTELDAYIDSQTTQLGRTFSNSSYHRVSEGITLEDPYNTLWKFNYLRVSQPGQPTEVGPVEGDRSYYYFITSIEHIAPNCTRVNVELDVWQTFIYDVTFGNCYVDRSHVGIAQQNTLADNGRRYLTVPEGLDTGSNMVPIQQNRSRASVVASDMIIYSTADLTQDWFDANGDPVTPGPVGGGIRFGETSGIGVYVIDYNQAWSFFDSMTDAPHIAQTIIAAIATPHIADFDPDYTYPKIGSTPLSQPPVTGVPGLNVDMFGDGWRELDRVQQHFYPRFQHLNKFFTFPYMQFNLSYGADNELVLRPDQFHTPTIGVRLVWNTSLADNQMLAYPLSYGTDMYRVRYPDTEIFPDTDWTRQTNLFVTTGTLPHLGTAKDSAMIALSSTAHTRAFQTDTADYSREKAIRAASNNYDAARRGIAASQQQSDITSDFQRNQGQRQAGYNTQDAWFNGARSVGMGVAGGALAGGGAAGIVGGAVLGTANAAMDIAHTNIRNQRMLDEIGYSVARDQSLLDVNKYTQGMNASANLSLSTFAANGDYQATIGAIEAQVQDTENIPPSMVAQPQGSVGALVRRELVASMTLKMIGSARMWAIGNYWLRYGYAIQEFMTPPQNLRVMDKFTYWKMVNCNIRTSPMPEFFKNVIRGIFEKGVTVYTNPDDIGVVSIADNAPITGDYY